jgi:hypothetical protein
MEMLRERMSFVAAATGLTTNIPNECVELMDLALNVGHIPGSLLKVYLKNTLDICLGKGQGRDDIHNGFGFFKGQALEPPRIPNPREEDEEMFDRESHLPTPPPIGLKDMLLMFTNNPQLANQTMMCIQEQERALLEYEECNWVQVNSNSPNKKQLELSLNKPESPRRSSRSRKASTEKLIEVKQETRRTSRRRH